MVSGVPAHRVVRLFGVQRLTPRESFIVQKLVFMSVATTWHASGKFLSQMSLLTQGGSMQNTILHTCAFCKYGLYGSQVWNQAV